MQAEATGVETERERVERWRTRVLERAGYDPEAVIVLSISVDVDLHEAVRLLDRGCDQRTALKILL